MTVAAIVLVPDAAAAVGDADGVPAIRRVAHAAWAGGALPIVVVAASPFGPLAEAVADSPVTLARPPAEEPPGIAWFVSGQKASLSAVTETTAGLLWPFRYAWVDPETVTSLVEAHGMAPEAIVRPAFAGQPGFPILVPISLLSRLEKRTGLHGDEAVASLIAEGVPVRVLELGDPGIVYDLATPRSSLPGYQGPPQPAAGPPPEWNAELAPQAQRSGEPGS
ncbi:MAG: NTP transferase domain-containing protein [Candidatus Limnocylindrales bacterium]|jgi:CTP:molybdopterin cytidylyltransferase MocA